MISKRALLFLFATCLFTHQSDAYTYTAASNTISSPFPFISTAIAWNLSAASIDYCSSSSCAGPTQLSAMLTYDGSQALWNYPIVDAVITDGAGNTVDLLSYGFGSPTPPYTPSSIPSGLTYPSTIGGTSTQFWYWTQNSSGAGALYQVGGADVVLGNYVSGSTVSTTDFVMGIFYQMPTASGFGTLYLDEYLISNPGTGSFSISYMSTTSIATVHGLSNGGRADIIADYNTPVSGTGKPLADKFVVMWNDINGLNAYAASLSNPSSGSTINVSASVGGGVESYDVACSQEIDVVTGKKIDVAHFAYLDNSGNLNYAKWYPPASSISGSPTFLASNKLFARIAAIRDPGTVSSGNNNWLIVSDNNTATTMTAYTNLGTSGIGTITLPTTGSGGGAGTEGAVVTAGPGSQYSIGTYDGSNYYNINTVQYTPSPTPVIDNIGYRVNTLSNSISDNLTYDMVGLSSSCNTTNDIFTGWSSISSCPTCQNDFYFKQAGSLSFKPAPVTKASIPAKLKVYPNPSVDILTISSDYTAGDNYTITDISGRQVMNGNITSNSYVVDVHTLPNGVYVINITGAKASDKVQFVKQ